MGYFPTRLQLPLESTGVRVRVDQARYSVAFCGPGLRSGQFEQGLSIFWHVRDPGQHLSHHCVGHVAKTCQQMQRLWMSHVKLFQSTHHHTLDPKLGTGLLGKFCGPLLEYSSCWSKQELTLWSDKCAKPSRLQHPMAIIRTRMNVGQAGLGLGICLFT